ncbi:MAG: ABC transporter permease [Candidatus Zixiibacteriota bacterium]|nr:MAG: ABC transporter permease [candidate division Zixibacteria bacterium]
MAMIANYLKISFRNIAKNRINTFINVAGMVAGLTACVIICLWVIDELSYDRFNENYDHLYRVTEQWVHSGEDLNSALTSSLMGPVIKEEIPEIIESSRFLDQKDRTIIYGDIKFPHNTMAYADPEILQMFSFPLSEGDINSALADKYSVLISESIRDKCFPRENPIGKTINIDRQDFIISGILKDIPVNSHLKIDCLTSFDSMQERIKRLTGNWNVSAFYSYVQLRADAKVGDVEDKITRIVAAHMDPDEESTVRQGLQHIGKIHLFHDTEDYLEGHGDIKYIYLFSTLAFLTLLIACINFMNISTARALSRSREVGIRKVVGARRAELISQFLGESIALAFISLFIAIVIIELSLPVINGWTGKSLRLFPPSNILIYPALIYITLMTGIFSGSYPALVLSSFSPTDVMKGRFQTGRGGRFFRRILVISQLILSVSMIVCVTVIYNQLNYIKNKDLGFDKEQVIYFQMPNDFARNYHPIRAGLLDHPAIIDVTGGTAPVRQNYGFGGVLSLDWEGKLEEDVRDWTSVAVDRDYIRTYRMEIVDGSDFPKDPAMDVSRDFIINETAAKAMGFDSPIGKNISFTTHDSELEKLPFEGRVIGIVKDFHYSSLHSGINPVIMYQYEPGLRHMSVRVAGRKTGEVIILLKSFWEKYASDVYFDYRFLDESIDNFYHSEKSLSKIIYSFTGLANIITCLGLFGLIAYSAEHRFKEIGIRKLLGASVSNIMKMMTKEFVLLVLIANLVAAPAAYYIMSRWLENFTYRIGIGPGTFFFAGLAVLVITFITVSFQSVKASLANPVEAIRVE